MRRALPIAFFTLVAVLAGAEIALAQPAAEAAREVATPEFAAAADAATGGDTARAEVVIKIIVGLAVLVVLAFLGAHPRVRQLERAIGISHAMTVGFPFVALGLIARHPSIGVLTDDVLIKLKPLMHFGLGWLGFMVGFRFVFPTLDRVPRGTALLVIVETSLPFACITVACGALLLAFGSSLDEGRFIRDAVVLGAAGAMTAPRFSLGIGDRAKSLQDTADNVVGQLDEIAGVVALLFLAAFFRPQGEGVAWRLPAVGWIFIELGAGVVLGVLMYTMVRSRDTLAEFLAVTIGFIAFAAGVADFLHLSPIVICFVAGSLVANFPSEHRALLWRTFCRLERPIHYIFLTVVGAVWAVGDWRGWVLVPAFVAARLFGKWLGLMVGSRALREQGELPEESRQIVTPLSVLAVAIVVSVQSLYRGEAIPWIVTAVLGGAIVTEVLVQLVSFDRPNARAAARRAGTDVPPPQVESHDPEAGE